MTAVTRLQEGLPPDEYGVAVVGLVDSDPSSVASDSVIGWPVSEFENLLLDPGCIVAAVGGIDSSITVTEDDKRRETVAGEQREDESNDESLFSDQAHRCATIWAHDCGS